MTQEKDRFTGKEETIDAETIATQKRGRMRNMEKEFRIPEIGESFRNMELVAEFKVQIPNGIRISNEHDFVLLIYNPDSNYEDEIGDNEIQYVGMGQGNQGFKFDKNNSRNGFVGNRRVIDPKYTLLYFEKIRKDTFVFRHVVKYVSHKIVKQENNEGKMRKVIMFKLKIIK